MAASAGYRHGVELQVAEVPDDLVGGTARAVTTAAGACRQARPARSQQPGAAERQLARLT